MQALVKRSKRQRIEETTQDGVGDAATTKRTGAATTGDPSRAITTFGSDEANTTTIFDTAPENSRPMTDQLEKIAKASGPGNDDVHTATRRRLESVVFDLEDWRGVRYDGVNPETPDYFGSRGHSKSGMCFSSTVEAREVERDATQSQTDASSFASMDATVPARDRCETVVFDVEAIRLPEWNTLKYSTTPGRGSANTNDSATTTLADERELEKEWLAAASGTSASIERIRCIDSVKKKRSVMTPQDSAVPGSSNSNLNFATTIPENKESRSKSVPAGTSTATCIPDCSPTFAETVAALPASNRVERDSDDCSKMPHYSRLTKKAKTSSNYSARDYSGPVDMLERPNSRPAGNMQNFLVATAEETPDKTTARKKAQALTADAVVTRKYSVDTTEKEADLATGRKAAAATVEGQLETSRKDTRASSRTAFLQLLESIASHGDSDTDDSVGLEGEETTTAMSTGNSTATAIVTPHQSTFREPGVVAHPDVVTIGECHNELDLDNGNIECGSRLGERVKMQVRVGAHVRVMLFSWFSVPTIRAAPRVHKYSSE
jgi:hypothetical protein